MRTLKTSLMILTLLAALGTATADAAVTMLMPVEAAGYSSFKNVVTGEPTLSLIHPPIDCLLTGDIGYDETLGYTVVAIFKGAPSRKFTVYTNGAISAGDQLSIAEIGSCPGYKLLEATFDEKGPASWDCLAFMPDDQTYSGFKNVVSGKSTASVVPPFDLIAYGFEGEQMGHTVHGVYRGAKPIEFTVYTNFPILPGDNLEMIEIAAVEGYKVYYVIVTE